MESRAINWLDRPNNVADIAPTSVPSTTTKRLQVPSCFGRKARDPPSVLLPGKEKIRQCSETEHRTSSKNENRGGTKDENRRGVASNRRSKQPAPVPRRWDPLTERPSNRQDTSVARTSRRTKPKFSQGGTFYGKDQPPSALQPLPHRPSYSEESDCESLIDDEDLDASNVEWVGELQSALGAYAFKDFSAVDKISDRHMHASFVQIMEEERHTTKIGHAVDRLEARRERLERREQKKKRSRTSFVLDDIDIEV